MKHKGIVLAVLGAIVAGIVAFCKWAYELGTSGMRYKYKEYLNEQNISD